MVVDDEPTILKLVKVNLEARGYGVVLAADGKECIEQIEGEWPDMILLDLRLPNITGWEVLHYLKTEEKLCKISVVIMAGALSLNDRRRGNDMGVTVFLPKPFSSDDLLQQVEQAISGKG